jgi:sterol desaturase/sphingolipid hydroxylase (fatty acid hydroxylase superfamily)
MIEREQFYQAVTLAVAVLCADFMERRHPAYAVDRRSALPLNILALFIVIAAGELWKMLLMRGLNALSLVGAAGPSGLIALSSPVKIFLGVVFVDFCLYWVHRAMHRPALWRTHTFHHSIEQLWWLSGARTSMMHLFLFAVPQVIICYYILDFSAVEAGIAFSFGVIVNIWIHTNLRVNIGRLEWLLITPNYHRVHHGARGLSNRNLGFVFTVWDRLFGTYTDPRSAGKEFALGVFPIGKRLLRTLVGY